MATITVRNISTGLLRSLKALAARNHRSMEQEVRTLLEQHVGDRLSAIAQIEQSWTVQTRRPTVEEIDGWIAEGRA